MPKMRLSVRFRERRRRVAKWPVIFVTTPERCVPSWVKDLLEDRYDGKAFRDMMLGEWVTIEREMPIEEARRRFPEPVAQQVAVMDDSRELHIYRGQRRRHF